jgi:hypothetical protein
MGMIYPDGRFMSYQGVVLPGGEPLPYLLNERTAGCLIGLLSETGEVGSARSPRRSAGARTGAKARRWRC